MFWDHLFNHSVSILQNMIEKPLIYTYLHGGAIFGLGGHSGRPESEICSLLTDVPSKHWAEHWEECDVLITSKIRSYEVLCGFLAYIIILSFFFYKFSSRALTAAEKVGKVAVKNTWCFLASAADMCKNMCFAAWACATHWKEDTHISIEKKILTKLMGGAHGKKKLKRIKIVAILSPISTSSSSPSSSVPTSPPFVPINPLFLAESPSKKIAPAVSNEETDKHHD